MNINENFKSSLKALDGPIHNFEDLRNFLTNKMKSLTLKQKK